jgi:hypothetical protein
LIAGASSDCPVCCALPPPAPPEERATRKRRYEVDDDDFDQAEPRRPGRRGREFRMPSVWWFVGIPFVLIALSFLARGSFAAAMMVTLAMVIGAIALLVGSIWFLIVVASDSAGQLLLCLFIPFYSIFYAISNFDETKRPFLTYLLGAVVVVMSISVTGLHGKAATEREEAEKRERAKEETPPVAQKPDEQPRPGPGVPKKEPPKVEGPPLTPENLNMPFDSDPEAQTDKDKIFLTALAPFSYQTGPWRLGIGGKGQNGKEPIEYDKKKYANGISLHPPQTGACRVSFAPGGRYKRFKGWAGIGDGDNPWGTVVFAVWGDSKKLWESGEFTKATTSVAFDIDITGVKVLVLETRMKSGHHHAAHAIWLDPWLER